MKKEIVIFDTGDGYVFETGKTCTYGKLLLAIAYISQGKLKAVYEEILEKCHYQYLMYNGERIELTDEERQHQTSIEEIIERYPLPEFLDEKHTATFNTPDDVLAAIDSNALECIEEVLNAELGNMCDRAIEDAELSMPLFLREDKFVGEVENVLINNSFQRIDMNKYCKNQLLSVTVQFAGGRMIKGYLVESLMQIIAIELLVISDKKVRYSRCPICNKLFEQRKGRGEASKYCSYSYPNGLCSDKGQKYIDQNRPEMEKKKKSLKNTIHHFEENHKGEFDKWEWFEELDILHDELVRKGVTIEIYMKKVKEWYNKKKASLKK